MPVPHINELDAAALHAALERCCGSKRWCELFAKRRPFTGMEHLLAAADEVWWALDPQDWLEAFSHHPKIGDIDSLRARFATTREWASGEQSGVAGAGEDVLLGLARGNEEYERKFGYIFIIFATGRSAEEMLGSLQTRLNNTPEKELPIAAAEQAKITKLRLEKLCQEVPSQPTC